MLTIDFYQVVNYINILFLDQGKILAEEKIVIIKKSTENK